MSSVSRISKEKNGVRVQRVETESDNEKDDDFCGDRGSYRTRFLRRVDKIKANFSQCTQGVAFWERTKPLWDRLTQCLTSADDDDDDGRLLMLRMAVPGICDRSVPDRLSWNRQWTQYYDANPLDRYNCNDFGHGGVAPALRPVSDVYGNDADDEAAGRLERGPNDANGRRRTRGKSLG